MPVKFCNLQIDQGASFTASWIWIGGGAGVNPAGTTALATFRQVPVDTPLLVSTTPNVNGSAISYLTPIVNYPYIAFGQTTPTLITVYPVQLFVALADVALMVFPISKWKLAVTWPSGTVIDLLAGDVEMVNI